MKNCKKITDNSIKNLKKLKILDMCGNNNITSNCIKELKNLQKIMV